MASDNPRTEWQRLEMFSELASEYFAAKDALGFPGLSEVIAGAPESKSYWLQQMQGMMLRKFFAPRDSIQIPKIAAALRACAVPEAADEVKEVAEGITWQFEQAQAAEAVSFKKLLSEGGEDAFGDLIYGRLLHANSAKYRRTQKMPAESRAVALLIGTADIQKALHLAWHNVEICRKNGWITDLGATPAAEFAWPMLPSPSA